MDRRAEAEDDLKATEDAIRSEAVRVAELEDEKEALDPGDARVVELSGQVLAIAEDLRAAFDFSVVVAHAATSGTSAGSAATRTQFDVSWILGGSIR